MVGGPVEVWMAVSARMSVPGRAPSDTTAKEELEVKRVELELGPPRHVPRSLIRMQKS